MVGGLLHRRQQIGLKLEAVEGTAEAPAAGDADLLVYDVEFEPDIERNERNPSRQYLTPLQSVVGKQMAKVSFGLELKGSGAVANAPSWGKVLKSCKMQQAVVLTIAVGAIAGGPIRPGDVISAAGGKTGLVIDRVANGAAVIPYVKLTGDFANADNLTADGSGATCAATADPLNNKGFCFRPVSTGDSSATISFWHDGVLHKMYGCRGTVKGTCKNGGISMLRLEFTGVYDATSDVAMPDPTMEATIPVSFVDVALFLDASQPIFASLDFDLANTMAPRESANASKGVLSVRVSARKPSVTIDPEMTLVADFDWFAKPAGSSISYARAQVGSVAGNIIILGFPALSYDAVKKANRADLQTLGVTLAAVSPSASKGDNEILISMM